MGKSTRRMVSGMRFQFFPIKASAFLFAAIALSSRAAAGEAPREEPLRVRLVRVIDGNLLYDWRAGSPLPGRLDFKRDGDAAREEILALEKEASKATDPATILSFIDCAPGDACEVARLAALCGAAERRLEATGWFYSASVVATPSASDEHERIILIEVTEGFRPRFGFDPWAAGYGEANFLGKGLTLSLTAGLDAAGLSLASSHSGRLPLSFAAALSYENGLGSSLPGPEYHHGRLALGCSYRLPSDISISLDGEARLSRIMGDPYSGPYPEAYDEFAISLIPGLSWSGKAVSANGTGELAADASVRGILIADYSLDTGGIAASGRPAAGASARLSLHPRLGGFALPLLLAGAFLDRDAPAPERDDFSSGNELGLRAAFDGEDLRVENYAFARAEAVFVLADVRLPPLIDSSIRPFIYTDQAFLKRPSEAEGRYRSAYGLGLRVLFKNPVFVSMDLSWGLSGGDIAAGNIRGAEGITFSVSALKGE
jgi:hypothetical protein